MHEGFAQAGGECLTDKTSISMLNGVFQDDAAVACTDPSPPVVQNDANAGTSVTKADAKRTCVPATCTDDATLTSDGKCPDDKPVLTVTTNFVQTVDAAGKYKALVACPTGWELP